MSLCCGQCAFFSEYVKEAVRHVESNQTHVVTGPGKEPDVTLTIRITDYEDLDRD